MYIVKTLEDIGSLFRVRMVSYSLGGEEVKGGWRGKGDVRLSDERARKPSPDFSAPRCQSFLSIIL